MRGLVLRQQLEKLYRQVGQHIPPYAPAARIKLLEGVPFIEIIREAQRGKHDLIIKTADSRGAQGGQLLGSTDLHLLRKSPVPVLIVDPAREQPPANALVLVDVNKPELQVFNERIIDHATMVAERLNCELQLLTVWTVAGEETMRNNPLLKIDEQRIQRIADKIKAQAEARIDGLARRVRKITEMRCNPQVRVVKGSPERVIPDCIEQHDMQMIIMGTVGHTDIPGMFIGNTAESLLSRVRCPVLTVKPADFVTPVTLQAPAVKADVSAIAQPLQRAVG